MSQVTVEIVEKLKTLTLLEAADLVSKIEETFNVTARAPSARIVMPIGSAIADRQEVEKTTFDVVLEFIAEDKRVATLKVIRSLTNLGLKEAKDFCSSLPKVVKERVSKEEAETIKRELEQVGGKVTFK